MKHLKRSAFLAAALFTASTLSFAADSGYHLLKKIPLGGEPKWDYLSFDVLNQRLYITHGNEVDVVEPESGKLLGAITGTSGVHGVVPIADAGIGYTSNGASNTSTLFDLKSLKVLTQVATGTKPDAIGYDPSTGCVYVCNGESNNATVIEAASGGVVSTIPLGGSPEYLAADSTGHVFVNLEKENAVVEIDTHARKVLKTWPLPAGSLPSSMAIDKTNAKLFIGCRNKTMLALDIRTGQVLHSLPIGDHVDATIFDTATGNIFNSCGEGVITVIHQDTPSTYSVTDTIKTLPGARTMALDPETHKLYLPAVDGKVFTLLVIGQ